MSLKNNGNHVASCQLGPSTFVGWTAVCNPEPRRDGGRCKPTIPYWAPQL